MRSDKIIAEVLAIMHILNLEDNVFKHHDICRAIERGSFENLKIDCVGNLADGLSKIEGAISKGKLYDLIITDMWYPENLAEPIITQERF